jgi:hypothetical protein
MAGALPDIAASYSREGDHSMSSSKITSSNHPALRPVRATLAVISMAASLAVATGWANALTTYESTAICPIDGKEFTATMVASSYQSGMRLDSRPLGALIAPYPYPVCPGNGFVMYQDEFSEDQLRAIRAIVLSDDYQRLRNEHTNYYMVAYVKERLEGNDYDLGDMYLRASWEAEIERPSLVQQYQALAIAKYDAFVKRDSTRSKDWWFATVVAAELDRLLGHFDAVEARLDGLARPPNSGLQQAIGQIRSNALAHNSKQEKLLPSNERTTGSGGVR